MTVYNRSLFIEESIKSVIKSSYKNWELIIVDDQSSDGSVAIAKQYEAINPRIKVFINKQNLGDYPNRNRAAIYAKGKYLKYLDSDDLIYTHGLEVMVNAMEKFPDAGFGFCAQKPEMTIPYPFIVSQNQAYKQEFLGNGFFKTGPSGTIIRRDAFEAVGGLSRTRYVGDYDSWLKLSQRYSVVVMHPGLIWWRMHDGQEYKKGQGFEKYLKATTAVQLKYLFDEHCPLNASERKLAFKCLRQRHGRRTLSYLIPSLKFSRAFAYLKYSAADLRHLFNGLSKSKIYYNLEEELRT
tara:strand:- start:4036 stop:4920 length:885 start_codon:yes stop_codon:yes gene_type:complete